MTDGFFSSPQGILSYRIRGQAFHSTYDPQKEVNRFLDQWGTVPENAVILLWGETLGYISAELRARYPGCRILALVPEQSLLDRITQSDRTECPSSAGDFQKLLEEEVREDNFSLCRFVVWPLARRILPEVTLQWEELFLGHFRRLQGSVMTQTYFGQRWLVNTLKNLQFFRHRPAPGRISQPLVIAASGPSLGESREDLLQYRDRYYLLSLPSSLRALQQWGIRPDAVMVTDGGYWSRVHLKYLPPETLIIQCPSGVFAPEIPNHRSFFSQGLTYETEILGKDGNIPVIPSQGTVATSALSWASRAATGPVIILGLDLAYRSGRSHVYPHTFEPGELTGPWRFDPLETQGAKAVLEAGLKPLQGEFFTTPSLETYASYFSTYRPPRPVHRCLPGPRNFPGFIPMEGGRLKEILDTSPPDPPQADIESSSSGTSFSLITRDWIASRIEEIRNHQAGGPVLPSLESLRLMLWPQKKTPDWDHLAALLERNLHEIPLA